MLDFLRENFNLILPLFVFLAGWLLPAPKFFELGEKAGEKIPPQLAKLIAERLEAFKRGLLEEDFRGDQTIIGNSQLERGVEKLKIDMGLKE